MLLGFISKGDFRAILENKAHRAVRHYANYINGVNPKHLIKFGELFVNRAHRFDKGIKGIGFCFLYKNCLFKALEAFGGLIVPFNVSIIGGTVLICECTNKLIKTL